MRNDPALVQRFMAAVEVQSFTLEDFHRRRNRRTRNRRIGATAVLGLILLTVANSSGVNSEPDRQPTAAGERNQTLTAPFLGSWLSRDPEGLPQLMEIEGAGAPRVRVRINTSASPACRDGAATWSGIGDLDDDGRVVVRAAVTCEDENVRADPKDFELRHDGTTDELVGLDLVWKRLGANDQPISVLDLPGFADLAAGTYVIDPDGDDETPLRVTFEVAAPGWSSWIGAFKREEASHSALSITTVENLARDACRDHAPATPPVGPTVDDLATALATLAPFQVTEPPTQVTVHGYSGKHLVLTVPDLATSTDGDDRSFTDCIEGRLESWSAPNLSGSFFGYNGEPGRTEEFWILDVEGTRLVIAATTSPGAPDEDRAELAAMVDSIRILK